MKTSKLNFLFSLFLLAAPVFVSAQTVKYVAYFPVPYLTHKTITAQRANFATGDNTSATISGKLTTSSIKAEKDLKINIPSSNPLKLTVGSGPESYKYVQPTGINTSGKITFSLPTNNNKQIGQVKADNQLTVKSIKWPQGTAFPAINSPTNAVRACWYSLRIKGTNEYRHYLVTTANGISECENL